MKYPIPRQCWKYFRHLPRKDSPPFNEVAAVQFFKLAGWATVIGGIYLLQERSGSTGLSVIPWLVFFLIAWDMFAQLGGEPEIERTEHELFVLLPRAYWPKLVVIVLFAYFVAWAIVFWLAPLIHQHGLANL